MLGKRVAGRTYAHVLLFDALSSDDQSRVELAIRLSRLEAGCHFHVARIDAQQNEVALLNYPTFFEEAFPRLVSSWRIHLPTASVRFRDYSTSLNPPILHRKEQMLPLDHPAQERFRTLTRQAEEIGLFDDPIRIGFRVQFNELIAAKGYALIDHALTPLGNAITDDFSSATDHFPVEHVVSRHLTALSRSSLSAPVQALLRTAMLTSGKTFFDFGCGKGDDVAGIRALGIKASGWDPFYKPDTEFVAADVVNLGFVINVIEDLPERVGALQSAYELTRGVLSVAAMLTRTSANGGRPYRDGFLSGRKTFQKYYSQSELQTFIESTLDEQPISVGPGIFFVFRDRHLEQQFLSERQVDASRGPRLLIGQRKPARPHCGNRSHLSTDALKVATDVSGCALQLGRMPDQGEYADAAAAIRVFGTWKRVHRAALEMTDRQLLHRAAQSRADEVRVFFAMQLFAKRQRLRDLEPRLRRDVRAFFGSLLDAEIEGKRLLLDCARTDAILACCQAAAAQGLGWLEADHSLQLHTSLVPRLPALLRAFIGCATALYGDLLCADLVKVHVHSGKVTLMKFDDFSHSALPRMLERVKVRLRDQELEYFDYGEPFTPPFLYFKSRYVNEEFPGYAEQLEFERRLEALGFTMDDEHGPPPAEFARWLAGKRHEVKGMSLTPSSTIPDLDERCGRYLTFRQLCECSETWKRTRASNIPRSPATYNALLDLATCVLDPVIDYFGAIKLTYGFASKSLTKSISRGIAPRLDQHSAMEVDQNGAELCARGGAAVDFLVQDENMLDVVKWIAQNCHFDRMYYYGKDRPIHVSVGKPQSRQIFEVAEVRGRRLPRRLKV